MTALTPDRRARYVRWIEYGGPGTTLVSREILRELLDAAEEAARLRPQVSELVGFENAIAEAFGMLDSDANTHTLAIMAGALVESQDELCAERDEAWEVYGARLHPEQTLADAMRHRQAEAEETARTLRAERDRLAKALREIQKGEGPFAVDPHKFACNVIESMKDLATAALAGGKP